MASLRETRQSASQLDIETLVEMAWEGNIRVPNFQRDFRWGWEDVRRLFDSIVRGYPIGSLLLWSRSGEQETLRLGALQIDAPATDDARWVVDGQQRLTSLANALHPDGQKDSRFALSYDLIASEFVKTPSIEDPTIIPLPVLFDLQRLLRWFSSNPELAPQLDAATQVTRVIRQYVVPLYLVYEDNPEVLQDIFDRMNNYGKRLSRAEIFSALNAGTDEYSDDFPSFDKIAAGIQLDLDFGLMDNDTILGAILARRGVEVRRDIRHEFDAADDEGKDLAYSEGEAALRRAVQFLQSDARVPHLTLLAYRYLLIALTRFFAFFPEPDERSKQLLRRWYWRAAVAGPEQFKGGTPNAARVLCSAIQPDGASQSVTRLLDLVGRPKGISFDSARFSTREAATKLLLCCLWDLGPRNPVTGERFTISDLSTSLAEQQTARSVTPYLVPKSSVATDVYGLPGNRLLFPSPEIEPREAGVLLRHQNAAVSSEVWETVLASHCIGVKVEGALLNEQFELAASTRQKDLLSQFTAFIDRLTQWDFEDTPGLESFVIEDLELDE